MNQYKKVLVLLVILVLGITTKVYAHAELVHKYPGMNKKYLVDDIETISLQFDEIIEPSFSSIEVYSSTLERMDIGEVYLDSIDEHILNVNLAYLNLDTYTIVWTVVSKIDGHLTSGLYTFNVGIKSEEHEFGENKTPLSANTSFSIWEVGIRWLLFSSAFIIFGGILVTNLIFDYTSNKRFNGSWNFRQKTYNSLKTLIESAIDIWFFANIGQFVFQALLIDRRGIINVMMGEIPKQLIITRFGIIWSFRQVLAVILFVFHRNITYPFKTEKIIISAFLLGSLSISSHNAAGALWPIFSTIVDLFHLLANGIWIGGLVALTFSCLPILAILPQRDRLNIVVSILRRFSPLALGSVVISFLTGVFSASLHFLRIEDIMGSQYGKTLLIKVLLVGIAGIIGLVNAISLKPKFLNKFGEVIKFANQWSGKLKGRVEIEMLIGFLIILTSSLLTTLPTPPAHLIPQGQQLPSNSVLREIDLPDNQGKLFFTLAPNWTGWNRNLIVIQDNEGNPISNAERVRLRYYLPKANARTDWQFAVHTQNGLYVSSGDELVLVGDWKIEIDIRFLNEADVRIIIDWSMEPPPIYIIDPGKPRTANWISLGFLGFSFGGVIIWRIVVLKKERDKK